MLERILYYLVGLFILHKIISFFQNGVRTLNDKKQSDFSKKEKAEIPLENYSLKEEQNDFLKNKQYTSEEKAAIVTFQKNTRMFLARRKYSIKHLKPKKQETYKTFVVGNDPFMPSELDQYHDPKNKIALIATSGMRAISLACKLGNEKEIPKIIIIDNSKEVIQFWDAMREFMKDPKKTATSELFLKNLPGFLDKNKNLYRECSTESFSEEAPPGVKYLNQDINHYFSALIKKYTYDYVRAVILHTSLIKQSWADPDVFVKIKNILSYQGINKIYMYPSNIVTCTEDKKMVIQILKNISETDPELSIHTNYCEVHCHPEKVYLFSKKKNESEHVIRSLFAPTTCDPSKELEKFLGMKKKLKEMSKKSQSDPSFPKEMLEENLKMVKARIKVLKQIGK